jgi:hypothetical protein
MRKTTLFLAGLGILYFLIFIPPNLTGTQDPNMLGVFETDEYAQYPHVIRMLTPGNTPYQTLRNFTVYLHYFYGYAFYFFSAISILPIKIIAGANWISLTPIIVLTLRQIISVLPFILSIYILVYIQTGFRRLWQTLILTILLLAVPAVLDNNFWWHLDSLGVLFVCLVFLVLHLDGLRFGRYFFLGALFCGIGAGIKYLGAFFVLSIPTYLLWGIIAQRISWRKAAVRGLLFVAVMIGTFILTNPLLLLPIERSEIIAIQRANLLENRLGFFLITQGPKEFFPAILNLYFGSKVFIFLALIAAGYGIVRKPAVRRTNIIILLFIITYLATISSGSTRRIHYYLPVLIPLYSMLVHLFPEGKISFSPIGQDLGSVKSIISQMLPWIVVLLVALQWLVFIRFDIEHYNRQMTREETSPSIAFFQHLEKDYLPVENQEMGLVVYRDWRVYVPPRPDWQIEMRWGLANMGMLGELDPDLILLEQANIELFTRAEAIENAVDPAEMQAWQTFYGQAARQELEGYTRLFENDFGLALLKEGLTP